MFSWEEDDAPAVGKSQVRRRLKSRSTVQCDGGAAAWQPSYCISRESPHCAARLTCLSVHFSSRLGTSHQLSQPLAECFLSNCEKVLLVRGRERETEEWETLPRAEEERPSEQGAQMAAAAPASIRAEEMPGELWINVMDVCAFSEKNGQISSKRFQKVGVSSVKLFYVVSLDMSACRWIMNFRASEFDFMALITHTWVE